MDQSFLQREKLILASKSPRRAEILTAAGWPFEAVTAGIDETRNSAEEATAYVLRLARAKANAVAERLGQGLVLGADTVVVIDGEILGQPGDREKARTMLQKLNGKWHEVITGIALVRAGTDQNIANHVTTRVRFSEMTEAEIDWYVQTDEPLDKAGAYAIQGLAAVFIKEIQGEYFNVVGLPVRLLYELSQKV